MCELQSKRTQHKEHTRNIRTLHVKHMRVARKHVIPCHWPVLYVNIARSHQLQHTQLGTHKKMQRNFTYCNYSFPFCIAFHGGKGCCTWYLVFISMPFYPTSICVPPSSSCVMLLQSVPFHSIPLLSTSLRITCTEVLSCKLMVSVASGAHEPREAGRRSI